MFQETANSVSDCVRANAKRSRAWDRRLAVPFFCCVSSNLFEVQIRNPKSPSPKFLSQLKEFKRNAGTNCQWDLTFTPPNSQSNSLVFFFARCRPAVLRFSSTSVSRSTPGNNFLLKRLSHSKGYLSSWRQARWLCYSNRGGWLRHLQIETQDRHVPW